MPAKYGCRAYFAVYITLVTLLGSALVLAQSDSAQISGFVKDPSGAVVSGAKISIRSQSKGSERRTTTNGQGYYSVPDLPPDVYTISVESPGFKRVAVADKKLDPSIPATVDFTLSVGTPSETVEVNASTATVQTESPTLGRLVDRSQIEQLELNGRNPLLLALTKAGVNGGLLNGNSFGLTTGNFNINGSRGQNNTIFFDGAVGVRTRSNATFSIGTADLDATQEVQILTSNYSAEYGRSSGGQIRIITRSGAKQFHGTAYEYFRNPVLNANSWTRKANPQTGACDGSVQPVPQQCRPNPFRYNQFGYRLGGPVIIPGTGFNRNRDKLFWSFSQEWVRLRQDQLAQLLVPTLQMRNGDFSELAQPNNILSSTPIFIRDPQKTGNCNATDQTACFNDMGIVNKIPASRLSPQGLALLRAFPTPNGVFNGGGSNWEFDRPNPTDQLKSTLAIDYNITQNQQLRMRGQVFSNKSFTPFPFGNEPGFAPRNFNLPNRWISLNHVWTISPTWVNEALVTASRDRVETTLPNTNSFKRTTYGITYPYIFTSPKSIPDKIPTVDISSFASINGGPYPSSSSGPIYQFADNVTHSHGKHTFKFGVLFERSGQNDFDQINVAGTPGGTNNMNGRFVFANTTACNATVPSCGTGTAGTGRAISNLAVGLFDTYAEIGARSYTPYRSHTYEFFGQDSWKVTQKLTLQLGARYTIYIPHWSLWRNLVVFDPATYDANHTVTVDPKTGLITAGDLQAQYNGLVIPGNGWPSSAKQNCRVAIACTGQFDFMFRNGVFPKQYSNVHYNDIQPRVGLAYALGSRSAIRFGIGRFVDHWGVSDSVFLGGNPPLQPTVSVTAGSVDNPGGKSGNIFTQQVTSQARDFPNPESWEWNGTFEREIGFSTVVSASYVGRRGLHLQREANINQLQPGTGTYNPATNSTTFPAAVDSLRPYKGFNIIRVTDNVANSTYHGLQLEATRRFSKGLAFGIAYTFSKSWDNGSAQRDIVPNALDRTIDRTLWGPSDFDRRHLLTVNAIYELPFFRDHSTLAGKLLGGWQVSEISQFRTGTPFSIATGDDFAGVGPGSGGQYWVVNGPVPTLGHFNGVTAITATSPAWIPLSKPGQTCSAPFTDPNACYFTRPTSGTFNTQQVRNLFRNPYDQNHNLGLFKDFAIGSAEHGQKLQFRAEAFNWLNHPNWNGVASTNPLSKSFGFITGKSSNREIQLALKYEF